MRCLDGLTSTMVIPMRQLCSHAMVQPMVNPCMLHRMTILNNESTLQLPRETTPVQCEQTQPVPGSPRNCDPDPDGLTSQLHRATQNRQPMSHRPYGNCDDNTASESDHDDEGREKDHHNEYYAKSTATKEAIYQAEKKCNDGEEYMGFSLG
ncbi:uncharacterized protein [Ptychodera flava]|uniref:uncharacterized protein n=1 Tax=Ptychodera flava TaxID=63121 RepID=UPI003969D519